MQVQSFFEMFFGFLRSLFDKLGSYSLTAFGVSVPITVILGAFIILSMIVNVFWKGVRG